MAVGGFSFFGGNDFGGSGKPKYGGIFLAVMQYGGNFLAVGGFSFSAVTTLAEAVNQSMKVFFRR